jgi:AcrR family transcriptional regulator
MAERVKMDRRVRRTRELLRTALTTLIQERGYDRITVQDILDEADIGRSTFYAHFRDKDDLLRSGFQDLRSMLTAENHQREGRGARAEFLHPVLGVIEHVGENRDIWKSLAGKGGADLVLRILRDNVVALLRDHFVAAFPSSGNDPRRLELAVQHVASALMGVMTWWLEDDVPVPAEEIYEDFRMLALKGVRPFMNA